MNNLQQLLQMGQQLQSKVAELQEKLDTQEISASAGGGMVKATVDGKGAIKALSIDPIDFPRNGRASSPCNSRVGAEVEHGEAGLGAVESDHLGRGKQVMIDLPREQGAVDEDQVLHQGSIRVPSPLANLGIHSGWSGQAGELPSLPSTRAS